MGSNRLPLLNSHRHTCAQHRNCVRSRPHSLWRGIQCGCVLMPSPSPPTPHPCVDVHTLAILLPLTSSSTQNVRTSLHAPEARLTQIGSPGHAWFNGPTGASQKALSSPPCFCKSLSDRTSLAERWRAEERDIPSLLMPGLTSSKSGCPVGLTSRWCQENRVYKSRMVSS